MICERYGSADIADLRDTVENMQRQAQRNYERIGEIDKAIVDLLHECEFSNYDVMRMIDLFKRLKAAREERRACKDENEILEPLIKTLATYPRLGIDLTRAHAAAQVREEQLPQRVYRLRGGEGYLKKESAPNEDTR